MENSLVKEKIKLKIPIAVIAGAAVLLFVASMLICGWSAFCDAIAYYDYYLMNIYPDISENISPYVKFLAVGFSTSFVNVYTVCALIGALFIGFALFLRKKKEGKLIFILMLAFLVTILLICTVSNISKSFERITVYNEEYALFKEYCGSYYREIRYRYDDYFDPNYGYYYPESNSVLAYTTCEFLINSYEFINIWGNVFNIAIIGAYALLIALMNSSFKNKINKVIKTGLIIVVPAISILISILFSQAKSWTLLPLCIDHLANLINAAGEFSHWLIAFRFCCYNSSIENLMLVYTSGLAAVLLSASVLLYLLFNKTPLFCKGGKKNDVNKIEEATEEKDESAVAAS